MAGGGHGHRLCGLGDCDVSSDAVSATWRGRVPLTLWARQLGSHQRRAALTTGAIAVVAITIGLGQSIGTYIVAAAFGFGLSFARPWLGFALPVLWVAVVGTELRPEMLGFSGPQYRLFDPLLAGAVVGAVPFWLRRVARPWIGCALLLGALALSTAATPLGDLSKAGAVAHQVLVAIAAYFIAARALRQDGGLRKLVVVLIAAGALAGAKAVVIAVLGTDLTGGPNSVAQAISRIEPGVLSRRVLLVGGAPFCVIAVPLALAYVARREQGWGLAALGCLAAASGVLLSLTRSNIAASGFACLLVLVQAVRARTPARGVASRATVVATLSVLWIVAVGAAWQTSTNPLAGAVGRSASEEGRAVSTSFRADEAEAVVQSLSGVEWVIGKGLGGEFRLRAPGLDPTGNSYVHSWPLWILLKSGLLGLVLAGAGLLLSVRQLLLARDSWAYSLATALVALLLAWLAVNGLPLAEGELIIGALVASATATLKREPAHSSHGSAQQFAAS